MHTIASVTKLIAIAVHFIDSSDKLSDFEYQKSNDLFMFMHLQLRCCLQGNLKKRRQPETGYNWNPHSVAGSQSSKVCP